MDLKIGDRVRVMRKPEGVWEPDHREWVGKEGIIERDPGDYGVRFPGEVHLRWFLGAELEEVC